MTTLSKTIYITFGLIILLTILRETGVVNLNYYHSNVNYSSTITWANGSRKDNNKSTSGSNYTNADISIIILQENDTLYKEINKLEPLIITIESFRTDPLWIPLYKTANFSVEGYPGFEYNAELPTKSAIKAFTPILSGTFSINGNVKIKGFCSHREAVQIVRDFVIKNFVENTKKHLSNTKGNYATILPLYKKGK